MTKVWKLDYYCRYLVLFEFFFFGIFEFKVNISLEKHNKYLDKYYYFDVV